MATLLARLNSKIISASHRIAVFVVLVALIILLLTTITALNRQFQSLSGIPIFDTSDTSTSATLLQELPRYHGQPYPYYLGFALLDLMFPLAIVLLLATLCALLLRTNIMELAQRSLHQWKLPLWILAGVVIDWTENISLLIAVHTNPPPQFVLEIAVLAKSLKWTVFFLSLIITLLLAILWLINRLFAKNP